MRALVVAAILFAPVVAHADGAKLALVVGVSDFQDDRWPALRYSAKDADDVATALESSFDRVWRSRGSVTTERFWTSLDALEAANTRDDDVVVIYVSSHGTLSHDERGALRRVLVASDTDAEAPWASGVAVSTLLERLEGLRSRRKLLILATCHAGGGKSRLPATLAEELRGLKAPFLPEPEPVRSEGQIVLAASAWGEVAREDDRLENDIYTHFFLQALDGFDLDRDGATTALEAHQHAREKTIAFTGGRQRPTLTAEIVGRDPIVLAGERRRPGDPLIGGFAPALHGARLEIDGRAKGILPGSFAVASGVRRVRVVRPGANEPMIDREVDVRPGEIVMVDDVGDPGADSAWALYVGPGWRNIHGARFDDHLSHPSIALALGLELDGLASVELELFGGYAVGPTRGVDTTGRTLGVSNALYGASVAGTIPLFTGDAFALAVRAELGVTAGRRAVELRGAELTNPTTEALRYGTAATGVEAKVWLTERFGLRLVSTVGLLLGAPGATLTDAHRVSAVVRF